MRLHIATVGRYLPCAMCSVFAVAVQIVRAKNGWLLWSGCTSSMTSYTIPRKNAERIRNVREYFQWLCL